MTKKQSRHVNWRSLIFERDDNTCYICGKQFNSKDLEVDHIMPLSKGGSNSYHNLKTLCKECNRKKGSSILDIDNNFTGTKKYYTVKDIAKISGKSERTIQRAIQKIKKMSMYLGHIRKVPNQTRALEVSEWLVIKLGYKNNHKTSLTNNTLSTNDKLIDLLAEQIKSKDEQINKIFNLLQAYE